LAPRSDDVLRGKNSSAGVAKGVTIELSLPAEVDAAPAWLGRVVGHVRRGHFVVPFSGAP
jgi:hypothetical protein